MSYRAGVGSSFPTIYCDSPGCDTKLVIEMLPPKWFRDNRPFRGWYLFRRYRPDGSLQRIDYCHPHKHLAQDAATRRKRSVTK